MSKLHLGPRTAFYADIHFVNSVGDAAADASGLVVYMTPDKTASASTLQVSVPSDDSYVFKSLVHTITTPQNSGLTVSQEGGIVTIDGSANGGGNGDTHFLGVIDSSANLDTNGACWVNTEAMFADYTYRHVEVHVFNGAGEKVEPTISFFNGGQAVKVDFKSKDEYVQMCSAGSTKIYVHIEVAPAYVATVTSSAPSARNFNTDEEAAAYEKQQTKTEATRSSSDIKPGKE